MTNAEKALKYFIIAVPEDKEQAEAYFWARKALNAVIQAEVETVRCNIQTNLYLLARIHELETMHRTEMCSDGYDCVQLGKARKAAADAEERVEKLDGIVHSLCSDLIEIANRFNFEIAKYCGHYTKKCVIINGFCQKRNINCLGFIPKQAVDL